MKNIETLVFGCSGSIGKEISKNLNKYSTLFFASSNFSHNTESSHSFFCSLVNLPSVLLYFSTFVISSNNFSSTSSTTSSATSSTTSSATSSATSTTSSLIIISSVDILYLLKKYQDKYNIIFKDYPDGYKNLWKTILKDIKADKILYVSNEYTVNDLLKISDLNILTCISTTFFDAIYFDADTFVIEEDIFEEAFEQKLKDEIFYFENTDKFKFNLEKYLE